MVIETQKAYIITYEDLEDISKACSHMAQYLSHYRFKNAGERISRFEKLAQYFNLFNIDPYLSMQVEMNDLLLEKPKDE